MFIMDISKSGSFLVAGAPPAKTASQIGSISFLLLHGHLHCGKVLEHARLGALQFVKQLLPV
jgi:hypothetical protein